MARTPALQPGDEYEYGISSLVRPAPGVEMWISCRTKSFVRDGESGATAARRIENFVEDRMNRKIQEVTAKKS